MLNFLKKRKIRIRTDNHDHVANLEGQSADSLINILENGIDVEHTSSPSDDVKRVIKLKEAISYTLKMNGNKITFYLYENYYVCIL